MIGLLATPATINREYTKLLIDEFAPNLTVLKIGSTALVKMAEQKLRGIVVDQANLQKIFEPWLTLCEKPDVIVLGCTHFPLLKEEIAGCFERQVQLVDPGVAVANRVNQLLGKQTESNSVTGYRAYYTKEYSETEKENLAALKQNFFDYGFVELCYLNELL
ncbi:hypothetical protein [Psychromonas sp. MME2]|uniref:hypothetical protein n=1 Tax=Psychromonas sp. MME2 TaxID=3231033 RepID=UPI00339BC829